MESRESERTEGDEKNRSRLNVAGFCPEWRGVRGSRESRRRARCTLVGARTLLGEAGRARATEERTYGGAVEPHTVQSPSLLPGWPAAALLAFVTLSSGARIRSTTIYIKTK